MTINKASYVPTAHEDYLYSYDFSGVYDYDSADDGPECETIKAILATHTLIELCIERRNYILDYLALNLKMMELW